MFSLLFAFALATSLETGELPVLIKQPEVVKELEINTKLFAKRPREKIIINLVKVLLPFEMKENGFSVREKQEMKVGDEFKAVIMNKKTQEIFVESNILQVEE